MGRTKKKKVTLEELGVEKGKADLFGGSDGEEEGIKLNEEYAGDYEKHKRMKEMTSLQARHEYDDDSSEGTEEDEDGTLLDNDREVKIFEALAALKRGDKEAAAEKIGTVNSDVKEHLDSILKGKRDFKEKRLTIKDYMREKLLEKGAEGVANIEDDEEAEYDEKYAETNEDEAAALKKAFIEAAEEEEDGLIVQKPGKEVDAATKKEVEEEANNWWEQQQRKEKEVNERLSSLFDNVDPNDKKEMFLKNFFLNQGWQGDGTDPTELEIDEVIAEGDREDDFEENQLKFEEEYEKNKYRHEDHEASVVQSHPRSHLIEDSLRKETNTRKEKRDRKKQREDEEKVKRDEEVKRLKHLKRQEMNEKLEELKKMAGAQAEELFTLADLEEDFDPETWDKKMSSLFNDAYYDDEDDSFDPEQDEEKPVFSDMSDVESDEEDVKGKQKPKQKAFDPYGEDSSDGSVSELSSDDSESDESVEKVQKTKKGVVKKSAVVRGKEEVPEDKKKEMEKRKKILLKSKEVDISRAMEDYSKLDYEGVVGGQKVRFKYRSVPKEQFGLTDDDVLAIDDRTLNQIAPLKYYAPYKSKSDNIRDAYVASQTKKRLQNMIDNPSDELQTSKKYRTGMAPVYIEYNDKAAEEDLSKLKKDVEAAVTEEKKKKKEKKPEKRKLEEDAVPPQVEKSEKQPEPEKKKKKVKKLKSEEAVPPVERSEKKQPEPEKKKKVKKVKKAKSS